MGSSSSRHGFFLVGVPIVGVLSRGRDQRRGASGQSGWRVWLEVEKHLVGGRGRAQKTLSKARPSQLQAHLVSNAFPCLGCCWNGSSTHSPQVPGEGVWPLPRSSSWAECLHHPWESGFAFFSLPQSAGC